MKKLTGLTLVILLSGCGSVTQQADLATKNGDKARGYFTDRGMTSEKIGAKVHQADNIAGQELNSARKTLSDDKGFSAEETALELGTADNIAGEQANLGRDHSDKKYVQNKNHVGASGNKARRHVNDRGLREVREGDITTTTQVNSNTSRIEELEKRMFETGQLLSSEVSRLEQASESNMALIVAQLAGLEFEMSSGDVALAAQISETRSELIEAMAAGDEALVTALEESEANLASQLSAASAYSARQRARISRKLAAFKASQRRINRDQESINSQQSRTNATLAFGLFFTNLRVNQVERSVSQLSYSVRGLQYQVSSVSRRVSTLERDVQAAQTSINSIRSEINSIETDISDIDSRIEALENNPSVVEVVDPCGDKAGHPDEVLFVMADGSITAWYKNVGLVVLEEGVNYRSTDKQKCLFKIENSEVVEL